MTDDTPEEPREEADDIPDEETHRYENESDDEWRTRQAEMHLERQAGIR